MTAQNRLFYTLLFTGITCFIFAALLSGTVLANTKEIHPKWESFERYYYFMDVENAIDDYLNALDNAFRNNEDENFLDTLKAKSTAAFFSQIFKNNPEKIPEWLQSGYSEPLQRLLAYAFILTEIEAKAPSTLEDDITFVNENYKIIPISVLSPSTKEDMHMLWHAFYASGNTDFIEVMAHISKENADDNAGFLSLVKSTITEKIFQHVVVERFVKKQKSNDRKFWGAVWSDFKSHKYNLKLGRKRRNDFTATILYFDPYYAGYFQRPVNFPELPEKVFRYMEEYKIDKTRPGKTGTILPLFSGFTLTKNYKAHVTYDLRIINPEGQTIFDEKAMTAFKGRIPTRFYVFAAKDVIDYIPEQGDAAGTYKIKANITDRIGGKTIKVLDSFVLK